MEEVERCRNEKRTAMNVSFFRIKAKSTTNRGDDYVVVDSDA